MYAPEDEKKSYETLKGFAKQYGLGNLYYFGVAVGFRLTLIDEDFRLDDVDCLTEHLIASLLEGAYFWG